MRTPTEHILKRVPTQEDREYYDGDSMAETLTALNLPCEHKKTVLSAQIATYHFDLYDPTDISKVKRASTALAAVLHCRVTPTLSDIAHFAFTLPIPRWTQHFRTVLCTKQIAEAQQKSRLYAMLGTDINNQPVGIDIEKMPHVLIAGATGSGKSVLLNSIISSILFNVFPTDCQFVMIDPKKVELSVYDGLPHLAVPVVKDHANAVKHLKNLCTFMDKRYELMAQRHAKKASDIGLSSLVVVIDELADLMLTSRFEVEEHIIRLAQLGRAAGIHLIIATQRPTVNVITGLIKSNIPCRIALQTASMRDSMNILDHKGAEMLTGKGDALLKLPDRVEEIRFQSAFIDTDDIESIVKYWFMEKCKA